MQLGVNHSELRDGNSLFFSKQNQKTIFVLEDHLVKNKSLRGKRPFLSAEVGTNPDISTLLQVCFIEMALLCHRYLCFCPVYSVQSGAELKLFLIQKKNLYIFSLAKKQKQRKYIV